MLIQSLYLYWFAISYMHFTVHIMNFNSCQILSFVFIALFASRCKSVGMSDVFKIPLNIHISKLSWYKEVLETFKFCTSGCNKFQLFFRLSCNNKFSVTVHRTSSHQASTYA
jgi:hypothetical protein